MTQETISAKRKNDAVITVCQNNVEGKLVVEGLNRAAEKLTGYRQLELMDRSLVKVLPESIGEILTSDLDYQDTASDLASILRKIPDFHVLNRKGNEIPVSLKVFYMVSQDASKIKFEILMRDIALMQKLDELKRQIQAQEDYHSSVNGLLAESAILHNLQQIHEFFQSYVLEVSVIVIAIDELDQLTSQMDVTKDQVMAVIGKQLKSSFRTDDLVGVIGHKYLCAILFDCSADDAQKALIRVKNKIESKALIIPEAAKPVNCKVSVGYMQIAPDISPKEALDKCKGALTKAQEAGGSRIYEVVD